MIRPLLTSTPRPHVMKGSSFIEAWQRDCWVLDDQDLGGGLRRVRVYAPGTAPEMATPCAPAAGVGATAADEDELSLLAVLIGLGGAERAPRPRLPVAATSPRALLPVVRALVSATTDGFGLWWLREAHRALCAADAGPAERTNVVPLRPQDHGEELVFEHLGEARRAVARRLAEGLLRPVGGGLEVMALPVSNALFELMDPSHAQRRAHRAEGGPATNVSWYEARLFAEWVGLRLPTSAERAALAEPDTLGASGLWSTSGDRGGVYEWCEDEAPSATAGLDLPLPDRLGVHEDTRRFIAKGRALDAAPVIAHPAGRLPAIGLRLVRGALAQRETSALRAVS